MIDVSCQAAHGGSNAVDIGADLKVPGRSAEVWGVLWESQQNTLHNFGMFYSTHRNDILEIEVRAKSAKLFFFVQK